MPLLALFGEEDDCTLVDALDGLFWDDKLISTELSLPARPGFKADIDEHPDFESLLPVLHFYPDTRCACVLAQHRVDVGDAPGNRLGAERRRMHFSGRA